MRRLFISISAVFLYVLCVHAVPRQVAAEIDRLIECHGDTACGKTDETGVWVVAMGIATLDGKSDRDARALASLEARNALAKFLDVQISSSREASASVENGKRSSYFSKWSREDVSTLLKGVVIECVLVRERDVVAIALMTEKTADAGGKLQTAIMRNRPGTVEASGEGTTKEAAVQAACRSALEQVCGLTMVASDAALNESVRTRVFSDVQGVVSAYRILNEEQTDAGVKVTLVAEITKDELLESYGAQMKSVGDPVFWITSDNDEAGLAISEFLMSKGIKTSSVKGSSDYKIRVVCDFMSVTHPITDRVGTQLHMKAVCFDRAGIQLFTIENDPRKASTFVGSSVRRQQIAVQKASKQISALLHQRLQRAISDMTNNGRTVRMVFRNTMTAEQCALIEKITEVLNDGMPGVSSATYKLNEDVRVATLRFTMKGNPQDLLGLLRKRVPECPETLTVSTNKIVFEF